MATPSAAQLAEMGLTEAQWNELQNSVANMDLSKMALGPLNLLGGTYSGPALNEADYLYTAPLSNKGNSTSLIDTGGNTFAVMPGQEVRLVDTTTGKVVYQGTGKEAANQIIQLAANLSEDKGNKAGWEIQTGAGGVATEWGGTTGAGTPWTTVAKEKVNKSALGTIADVALPVAASLLVPGGGFLGTILPAAGGSAVSSVAQGRSLGNTLLRAGLAGAGAGLGEAIFTPGVDALGNSISNTASNAINAAYQAAQQGAGSALGSVYGSTVGSTIGSAAGSAAGSAGAGLLDDIVVNAIRNAGPSFLNSATSSLASSLVPSFFDSAQLDTMQTGGGTKTDTGAATDGGELVITAGQTPTNILPSTIGGTAVSEILSEAAKANAKDATSSQNDRQTMTQEEMDAVLGTGPGGTNLLNTLTKNMGVTDYLTLASLAGGLLGGSGGGGGGASGPYTSPFGGDMNFAPAARTQINPNIADYEKYGFGPEATFFSGAQTSPGASQMYNPLVTGGTTGGTVAPITTTTTTPDGKTVVTGGTTGGTVAPITTTTTTPDGKTVVTPGDTTGVRPSGFTGTMANQKPGDTQVVDGTTWVWGGDNVGWQMQYVNPETKQTAVLPGNGATNVSSFANNPTVAVNQPYFAQNTANIPGWAETYRGFQRSLMNRGITGDAKAAAEQELFTALETIPFNSAIDFVDYARSVSSKYPSQGLI